VDWIVSGRNAWIVPRESIIPARTSAASEGASRPPVRWTETRTKPSWGIADVSSVVSRSRVAVAIHFTVLSWST